MREPARKSRISELDALRGVAAMVVVLSHLMSFYFVHYLPEELHRPRPRGTWVWFPDRSGTYAVLLFFVISGFVIFMTLKRVKSPKEFFISRFSRLYPAYWVCVLATFGVVTLLGLPNREPSGGTVLVNLTMLHAWFGVPHVDGVYWSLFGELSFYVLACIIFFSGLFRFPNAVAWVWIIFCLAVRLFEWRGAGGLSEVLRLAVLDDQVPGMAPHRLSAIARLSVLAQYAPLFMAGVLFYHLFTGQSSWKTHVTLVGCFLAHNLLNWSGKQGVLVAIVIFAAFYLFAYGRLKFVAIKPLLFLGTISYPLYLVHCNVGMAIMRQFDLHGININLAAFVAIAAAILLATVISYGFEQPGTKLIRGLLMPKPAKVPSVAPNRASAISTPAPQTLPQREPVA